MCRIQGSFSSMRPANGRRRYSVTSSPIGWAHTQNDLCSNSWNVLYQRSVWHFHMNFLHFRISYTFILTYYGLVTPNSNKQRVLMHGHQGWNVRHGLCHIYMIYVYIWVVYSFCLFCCLFIIVTTQFVALYKPCKPKPKPSTYDPPDNHPLAEIQRPILRPEPKQQICHQHANTDHFGK